MPGSSLRRARSPVAPTRTTTCGNCGPTPDGIFAIIHILFNSIQFDFRLRGRPSARQRRIAPAMVGVDQRIFYRVGPILAGRVQSPAIEEHRVARREARRFSGAQDRGTAGTIGAEELRLVEPAGVERHAVRTWHEP